MADLNYALQEELLPYLGERETVAMVHESWGAEMWVEFRYLGFTEETRVPPGRIG